MASPNSTFTQMVTTTLREHPNTISDAVSQHNALFNRLKAKKRIKTIDGGYEIVEPLAYAENSTYTRYSGLEALNIEQSDVLSAAKYDWKQMAVNVVASGLELRNNAGKNRIIDLAKAKLDVAKKTFANNMNEDLYSDGTASGGKQIGGLSSMITTDGTGTVGGISSSAYAFWANKFKDGNSATSSTIQLRMNELWLDTVRGTDKPDLIISSTDLYTLYWNSLQALQRFTQDGDGSAGAGFTSLKYMTADVHHETLGSGITANRMYFLNTDYLKVVAHRDANMTVGEARQSVNQDGEVIPILFQGNLVCSNRALQGVLFD